MSTSWVTINVDTYSTPLLFVSYNELICRTKTSWGTSVEMYFIPLGIRCRAIFPYPVWYHSYKIHQIILSDFCHYLFPVHSFTIKFVNTTGSRQTLSYLLRNNVHILRAIYRSFSLITLLFTLYCKRTSGWVRFQSLHLCRRCQYLSRYIVDVTWAGRWCAI